MSSGRIFKTMSAVVSVRWVTLQELRGPRAEPCGMQFSKSHNIKHARKVLLLKLPQKVGELK